MTTKAKELARTAIGLGFVVGAGAIGGVLVAWLKTAYGISPYWFIGMATGLAVLATGSAVWSLTRPRKPMFVLDWVVSFEGIIALTLLSAIGLVVLVSLVLSATILLVVTLAIVGFASAIIIYIFNHARPTTWDDGASL